MTCKRSYPAKPIVEMMQLVFIKVGQIIRRAHLRGGGVDGGQLVTCIWLQYCCACAGTNAHANVHARMRALQVPRLAC